MRSLFLLLAVSISLPSLAVVVDEFNCEIERYKDGVVQNKSSYTTSVPRTSLNWSPYPGQFVYSGYFGVYNKTDIGELSFNLNYQIATDVDAAGIVTKAVGASCLSVDHCDYGTDKEAEPLNCSVSQCKVGFPQDPFDPRNGWEQLRISPDGMAVFPSLWSPQANHRFSDGSLVALSCKFTKTIR